MYNNLYNFVNNKLSLLQAFYRKSFKIYFKFFCRCCWFLVLYVTQIFYAFSKHFTGTIIRAPKLYLFFIFCLNIFKLSTFFNSVGKSFQRISPIVSKPNLFVLMFRLFTVTSQLRLQELFSLILKISRIMRGERSIFTLYISVSKCFIFL